MNEEITKIEDKINGVIAAFDMLPKGCVAIVGFSGGADSMALTHFLHYRKQVPVLAAHINHGLRGKEADADEQFVCSWCEANGVPFRILRADVAVLASQRHEGLEECGRNVRYEFFQSLVRTEADRIATAHTLSDQAETVLLNLAKGSGAKGLCGIPAVRKKIVRPLLGITRTEVETYCRFYELAYVTDSTNMERDFARNRIRLDVIPILKEINPSFEESVRKMSSILGEDTLFLEAQAKVALVQAKTPVGYRADMLAILPKPILARVVMAAVKEVTPKRLEQVHIEAAIRVIKQGGSATLAGGIQITVSGNTLFVTIKMEEQDLWEIPLLTPSTCLPDGRILTIRKISRKEFENIYKFNNFLFNNLINYDTITNSMSIRTRRDGDVFKPAGRGITKTLKKLFNEAKIPVPLRSKIILLENGTEILWAEGFGASEVARVTEETKNIAEICIRGAMDVK